MSLESLLREDGSNQEKQIQKNQATSLPLTFLIQTMESISQPLIRYYTKFDTTHRLVGSQPREKRVCFSPIAARQNTKDEI